MRDGRKVGALLVVFLVALALRLLFLIDLRPSPYFDNLLIDPASYDRWGREIAAGDFWGSRVYYQAPLYAYFLGGVYAIFGRDLLAARVVQAVIGSITCLVLLVLTSRIFSFRAGLLAGLLAAFYTTLIFQDGMILKSVVVLFFLASSLLVLAEWTVRRALAWLLLSGLLLGVAITGRGNLIFSVPFLAAWILLRERTPASVFVGVPFAERRSKSNARVPTRLGTAWKSTGVFLLGCLLAVAPVTIRNRVVGGDWVLVESDAGINVYVGNNPAATGIHTPPFDIRTVPEHEEEDAARFAERETGRSLKPSEVSSFWIRKALAFARSHPGKEARLFWKKLLLAWNGYEIPDNYDQSYFGRISWIFRGFLPGFLWIAPFAVLGFALSLRDWRRAGLLHAFVLSYLISLLVLYVTSRYRLPIVVGLIPLAAHGVFGFAGFVRERAVRRVLFATVLLVAVLLVGRLDHFPYRGYVKQETELATFHANRGDLGAAERAFERAILEGEGSGNLHLVYMNQGLFFARGGRIEEAEEAFRNALRVNPSFTPALAELQKLEQRVGGGPVPSR
jgi:tetratricopeptide (TPR) repeat protein